MEDSLKKLVYAGVGFAAQATEKFEKSINDLVKKGKLEEKEGKKIVDDFFSKTEKTKDSFESKFKQVTEDVVSKLKFAPKNDVKSLTKRIEKLEKMLGAQAPKKATTKTAAKAKKVSKTAKTAVKKTSAAAKKTADTAVEGVKKTVAEVKA